MKDTLKNIKTGDTSTETVASLKYLGTILYKGKGKGKGHPRTGHEGPEEGVEV
jgi:hypothetical protein